MSYYREDADWSLIPNHMREGVAEYVMDGVRQGDFLTAVFSNNFAESAARADFVNRNYLAGYATFLHNFVPLACWGSPEKVLAWITHDGLNGLARAKP